MDSTWIKLYRKAAKHDVFFDESAWRVWTWILMSVNYETGEMELGRYTASDSLRMNPNTFKSVIDRLRKKYNLIETTNKHTHTLLHIKNWHKYQAHPDSIVDNEEVTPGVDMGISIEMSPPPSPQGDNANISAQQEKRHSILLSSPPPSPLISPPPSPQDVTTSDTTIQEIKNNKEIKKDILSASEIPQTAESATPREKEKKPKLDIADYFLNIPEDHVKRYVEVYNVTEEKVRDKAEDFYDWWCKLSPARKRNYSDPAAIFRSALKRDFGKRSDSTKPKLLDPEALMKQEQEEQRQLLAQRRATYAATY
jgi:hypothetical protein